MKSKAPSIREMRAARTHPEEALREKGELVITRRGRPIARVLPVGAPRPVPSHAELRAAGRRLKVGSEGLVRADRDAR